MTPQTKVGRVMGEFQRSALRSGSPKGPVVTSKKQAAAIALNAAGKTKKPRAKKPAPPPMIGNDASAEGVQAFEDMNANAPV